MAAIGRWHQFAGEYRKPGYANARDPFTAHFAHVFAMRDRPWKAGKRRLPA
jgi:hypothetical protein